MVVSHVSLQYHMSTAKLFTHTSQSKYKNRAHFAVLNIREELNPHSRTSIVFTCGSSTQQPLQQQLQRLAPWFGSKIRLPS